MYLISKTLKQNMKYLFMSIIERDSIHNLLKSKKGYTEYNNPI